MSDHPKFVALKERHATEINELTAAFAAKYSALMSAEPHLREPKAIADLRQKHASDIRAAVARHTKLENEWREPAPAGTAEVAAEPAKTPDLPKAE